MARVELEQTKLLGKRDPGCHESYSALLESPRYYTAFTYGYLMQQTADRKIKTEEVKQYAQPQHMVDPYQAQQQSYDHAAIQYVEDDQQHYEDEDMNQHDEDAEQQQQYLLRQQPEQEGYIDTEDNPQQLISDIDPRTENNIYNMAQKAMLIDSQPIRTACFSPNGNYIALGTNSKTLKICALPHLLDDDEEDDDMKDPAIEYYSNNGQRMQKFRVIYEAENHHNGSLYCVDWSRSQRLIASGSNDRFIKILVVPQLDGPIQGQSQSIRLEGHSAIVRTVCFNPADDSCLLSGGLNDTDVKLWNSETGKNIANLKGHQGSIYSIKMTQDGAFAMSVGTDKYIRLWDIRQNSHIAALDGTQYNDMNEIAFTQAPTIEISNILQGLACVGHVDGSLTYWDLNMRKCLAQTQSHQSEARGVSFSIDGKYLASAGFDGVIHITDTSDLDSLQVVKSLQHEDKVVSVRWHPHLPLLLSTSADKSARIWYPQTQ